MEIASASAPVRSSAGTIEIVLGLLKTLRNLVLAVLAPIVLTTAIHFPYHTDSVVSTSSKLASDKFYAEIYQKQASSVVPASPGEYVQVAGEAIARQGIVPAIKQFVEQYHLEDKRVLDVGAGTGYLQDLASGYVGLDISPTARRFFHKPFIEASATSMPIPDNAFDAVWSIWVLEHVPNPEQALVEMRRVVKDGGLMYLLPAWNCTPWAANGYEVRPYSDFGLGGKLIKASVPIRGNILYRIAYMLPVRFLRAAAAFWSGRPTQLHYHLLAPNYEHYWVPDSDALNSIDSYEMLLWFTSRGDECLNCDAHPILATQPLILRVHKNR